MIFFSSCIEIIFVKRRRKEIKKFRKKILKRKEKQRKSKVSFPPVPWCSYQCTQKVNRFQNQLLMADVGWLPDPLVPDVITQQLVPTDLLLSKFLIYCCKQSSRPAEETYWRSEWKTNNKKKTQWNQTNFKIKQALTTTKSQIESISALD